MYLYIYVKIGEKIYFTSFQIQILFKQKLEAFQAFGIKDRVVD
jgi:hypothetical protein